MADMGACVIKIEPPADDTTRYISAAPEPGMGDVNRSKRSVVLDLCTDDSQKPCARSSRAATSSSLAAWRPDPQAGERTLLPSRRVVFTYPDLVE
jgi:crotonobetainyl-CoA:carnitine CoA-transferase CaiB-like acyl-CoA transferase